MINHATSAQVRLAVQSRFVAARLTEAFASSHGSKLL
jgi:hypothetical protein